jgi:hypothetical protein
MDTCPTYPALTGLLRAAGAKIALVMITTAMAIMLLLADDVVLHRVLLPLPETMVFLFKVHHIYHLFNIVWFSLSSLRNFLVAI